MKELLPIGSVVLLEEGKKNLMIIGLLQRDEEGNEYDYVGLMHPEGYINHESFFLFNQEDINRIIFIGCINADTQVYFSELKEIMKNK